MDEEAIMATGETMQHTKTRMPNGNTIHVFGGSNRKTIPMRYDAGTGLLHTGPRA